MRTASYIPNQKVISNSKQQLIKNLISKAHKQKSKSKDVKQQRKKNNNHKNQHNYKKDILQQYQTIKFHKKNLSKTNSYTNTGRNSLSYSAQKNKNKQNRKDQVKVCSIKQNQITNNLEIQAKKFLNFLKNQLNSQSGKSYHLNRHQRIRINQWLLKLQQPMHNDIWRQNRNFYLKVLIEMICFGIISEPFSNVPSDGQLPKLTLYDVAFPIRQRLLQQKNETKSQKTRQKSRKNSINRSRSKNNKQNDQHMANMMRSNFMTNDDNINHQDQKCEFNSTKKIKAGTRFLFATNNENGKFSVKKNQNFNKINFIANSNKESFNRQLNDRGYTKSSVQMIKKKIFNQISNLSSINNNDESNSALINDSDDSQILYSANNKWKGCYKMNKKIVNTMKTQEFMKTSLQEDNQKLVFNEEKSENIYVKHLQIQRSFNVLSQLQLMLWQKQKNFKNNQQYHVLKGKISNVLNKVNKKIFQQSSKFQENGQNIKSNKENNASFYKASQSFDMSKFFSEESQSKSFMMLSQKVKSKFNKTGKDTKQFLDFLRNYH